MRGWATTRGAADRALIGLAAAALGPGQRPGRTAVEPAGGVDHFEAAAVRLTDSDLPSSNSPSGLRAK